MTASPSQRSGPLEAQAKAVLPDLRAALARVLASMNVPARRPRDLCKALGVHQTLAWKILRVVDGPDLLADAQYIPGPAGIERFLAASQARGVPEAVIADARGAFERFRELIEAHAGDRPSLELMLNGIVETGAGASADGRAFRKAGFRCASSTWGVQVRTRLLSQILHPTADHNLMDVAVVRGSLGMRRIRPGASLPLAPMVVLNDDGELRQPNGREPLDPGGVTRNFPLMPRFCSKPLPEIRVAPGPSGAPEYQLGEAPVGGRSGMTIFLGEVHRAIDSCYSNAHNAFSNTALSIRLPIETAVVDVWVHRDLFPGARSRALLYGELSGVPWYQQTPDSAERLPLADRVETLGAGLHNAPLTDAPQYRDAMDYTFQRLGWDPDAFTLHRLRVEYPVIATALVVQLDLPDRDSRAAAAE